MIVVDRDVRLSALDPAAVDHWLDVHVPDWTEAIRIEVPTADDTDLDPYVVRVVRRHLGPDLGIHLARDCPDEHPGGDPDVTCLTVTDERVGVRFPLALLR